MLEAFAIAGPSLLPNGADRHPSACRNNYSDVLAVLAVLAAGRNIDTESRRRATARLAGLPSWLTAMIVRRHAKIKYLSSVDIEIANILSDFENEGILGPAS